LLDQLLGGGGADEAVDINVDEGRHQELAIETIHDSSVSWNNVPEIFNLKRPLESTGEEPAEGADNAREDGHEEGVQQKWVDRYGLLHTEDPSKGRHGLGEVVLLRPECGRGLARVVSHPAQLFIVLDGADEVGVLATEVGQRHSQHNRRNPTAYESFPCLLGAQLDQGSFSHEESEHVGHHIVHNDHHDRHDEPDEALEHILNNEITLGNDDQKGDVGPGEQRKLSHVILSDKGQNEPNESPNIQ